MAGIDRLIRAIENLTREVLSVGGMAGAIALLIAGAISIRYLEYGNQPIPETLLHALTTIPGFYLWTAVKGHGIHDQHDERRSPGG